VQQCVPSGKDLHPKCGHLYFHKHLQQAKLDTLVGMRILDRQVLGGLPDDVKEPPSVPTVQGHELLGGPQMIQLS
jgi:hypothetical protein